MNEVKKLLALVQLPPPVHGASMMNQAVIESSLINSQFLIKCIPLRFASSVSDISTLRLNKFIKTADIALRLISALIKNKFAFVYFTLSPVGYAFYRDLLFVSIIKLFRVKILYHLHGKGIKKEAESNYFKRQLYKFTFRNTSVIALAQTLVADIEAVYDGTPFIVNNGIATWDVVVPVYKEDNSCTVKILYLSNLARTKGILIFIDSLRRLGERNVQFQADIIGNDFDVTCSQLIELIKNFRLDDSVHVLGPRYGSDKFYLLNASDIFCFPTFYEAFPLVILEAMQCGKPVVSTFEGAIPELVDNLKTGLLVNQQDPVELADALQQLIEDKKLREQMGEYGKKKFYSFYTIRHFENNILHVFNTVAETK